MTKETAKKIVEKLLFEVYDFDKQELNKINKACGNNNLECFSDDEIYAWLKGIRDGLVNFRG